MALRRNVSYTQYILDRRRIMNLLVTEFSPNEIKMLKISCFLKRLTWNIFDMKYFSAQLDGISMRTAKLAA